MPTIRTLVDLSTDHLPPRIADRLNAQPGVVAYPTGYGFLMWVPDDPDEHSTSGDEPVPDPVLAVQRYARSHGCDYVLIDVDADRVDDLPTWP